MTNAGTNGHACANPHAASADASAAARPAATTHAAQRALRPFRVDGLGMLEELRDDWTALLQSSAAATPFDAPAWLLPWARHFAPDRTRAIALRGADRLVALTPFFTWQGTLFLAGTGPSDYGAALFAPGFERGAADVLAALGAAADEVGCREIDLQQLRPGSPLLNAPAPAGWADRLEPGVACPLAPLDRDPELRCISPRWRRNLARAERLLRADAAVDLGPASAGEIDRAAGLLEELHARRWHGESAVFGDARQRAFIADVLPALARAGLLRLHCLRLGDRTLAVAWLMACGRAAHFYLCAFDPAWSRFSPGLLTIMAAMRGAAAEGVAECHFLRGQEPYKYHLGAVDRPTWRRRLRRAGT